MLEFDEVMNINFNECRSKISAKVRKTVLVREYETMVFEAENEIEIDGSINGIDRYFIETVLQSQLEMSIYTKLFYKGFILEKEYLAERNKIKKAVSYAERYARSKSNDTSYIDKIISINMEKNKIIKENTDDN